MVRKLIGSTNSLWNAASVGVSGTSNGIKLARSLEAISIFATASAATTLTVQVAHQGNLVVSEAGVLVGEMEPDTDSTPPTVWFNLFYLNTAVTLPVTTGGFAAVMIPDMSWRWLRLSSSAAATITAGWSGVTG